MIILYEECFVKLIVINLTIKNIKRFTKTKWDIQKIEYLLKFKYINIFNGLLNFAFDFDIINFERYKENVYGNS